MAAKTSKYIFVTGGVLSGLGKGITAASLGTILKARGWDVGIMKCDPYLNTDAGTLNPAEHGEVFVTKDGAETDLDLGHYERFIDTELTRNSSLMNGRIYAQVIADERAGKYLGKTVQIIPHVTAEIQRGILEASKGHDIHIVEIGGTVGDYESLAFLEAIRQFKHKVGAENVMYVHVVYIPYLGASKEFKTKPAQNALRDLRETGIQADMVMARAEDPMPKHALDKLSLLADIAPEGIVPLPNASTVYEVPLTLEEHDVAGFVARKLGLKNNTPKLDDWRSLVEVMKDTTNPEVTIGVVAKYMHHEDTYTSVFEAVKAAGWAQGVRTKLVWIDAEKLTAQNVAEQLGSVDGIVVPGGFGSRGVEGKIMAADYAMRNNLPYLGLCLGMQVAVIAKARDVLGGGMSVNTAEIDQECKHPVIALMDEQAHVVAKGGTMRLGDYPCVLAKESVCAELYGTTKVVERHRHRFEVNNDYRDQLVAAGMKIAGTSPDGKLVEMIEIPDHRYFVATQAHPEFKSRPNRPHPLFVGLIHAIRS
jgi:CTP synthase